MNVYHGNVTINAENIEKGIRQLATNQVKLCEKADRIETLLTELLTELRGFRHDGKHLEQKTEIKLPYWWNMLVSDFITPKDIARHKYAEIFDLLGVDTFGGVMCHTVDEIFAIAKKHGFKMQQINRFMHECQVITDGASFGCDEESFRVVVSEQWVPDK